MKFVPSFSSPTSRVARTTVAALVAVCVVAVTVFFIFFWEPNPIAINRELFDRRFFMHEDSDKKMADRSWQRREMCQPYSPRLPPHYDGSKWPACRDATDLVAFEIPHPQSKSNMIGSEGAAAAGAVAACRQREAKTAADVKAGMARDHPAMAQQIVKIEEEFQRRRAQKQQQQQQQQLQSPAAVVEEHPSQNKRKRNMFITFATLKASDEDPLSRRDLDGWRVFLYSWMVHAVVGRDVMMFVTDDVKYWRKTVDPISDTVSWEKRQQQQQQQQQKNDNNHGNVSSSVVLISFDELSSFLPPGANEGHTSNRRVYLLDGLLTKLIHEEQAQKDDPAGFEYGHIITGDSRDIVFFGNCFDALAKLEKRASLEQKPWLLAVAEQYQIVESSINRYWASSYLGRAAEFSGLVYLEKDGRHVPRVAPNGRPLPIVCSGLYAAKNLEVMSAAVYAFRMLLEKVKNPRHGVDQGAWNVLMIHLPTLVDMSGILSPIIVDPLVQPFARHHIRREHWKDWKRDPSWKEEPSDGSSSFFAAGFMNCVAGEKFAIMHQLDRYSTGEAWAWGAAEVVTRIRRAMKELERGRQHT